MRKHPSPWAQRRKRRTSRVHRRERSRTTENFTSWNSTHVINITAYATLTQQVSQSFGDLPGKKGTSFRGFRKQAPDPLPGKPMVMILEVTWGKGPAVCCRAHQVRRRFPIIRIGIKKHIIPLNSSSLDFQLPRGIGQIQVETIWHIATTASCHLPALHILEKWILKFKVIPLAPHQNSRNHETKNCYWSSGLRSSWEGDHFHLQQNLRLKTPYSPKSEEYANIEKSQWEISTHNHFGSPDRKRWETPHLWLETYLSSNENPSTQTHFLGQISILPKETWQQDPTNRRKASNFWDVPSSHLTFRRIHPHSPVLRTPRCSCRWRASQYPTISLFADAAI